MHKLFPKTIYQTSVEGIDLEKQLKSGDVSVTQYNEQKEAIKNKYSFLGFTNKRRFVLAIGHPLSLFLCSFLALYFAKYLPNNIIRRNAVIAATLFLFTSCYFIGWNLWWYKTSADFPRWMYYTSLAVIAVITTYLSRSLINGWYNEINNIKKLKISFVDFLAEIRNVHYKDLLKTAMEKDLSDEEYQTKLKSKTKKFQNRTYEEVTHLTK